MVGAKTAEAGQFERTSVNSRCTVISKARLDLPIVRSSVRNSIELTFWDVAILPFRVCTWDLFSPIQISTCSIDRTPFAPLSLSCSPFATRRILFLDSGERASERGGLAKALDRNERPFCAALRWARSLSRSVGRTRLWCNAIIHRQSTVVCRVLGETLALLTTDGFTVHTCANNTRTRARGSFAQISEKRRDFARAEMNVNGGER